MLHPRYLKINNRPVFKILIPDVFLTVECGSNATLAKKLLDQLRDTATKRGLEEPLVGAGWFNPSVRVPCFLCGFSFVFANVHVVLVLCSVIGWLERRVGSTTVLPCNQCQKQCWLVLTVQLNASRQASL